MRYNRTERLGVVETDLIVTKELEWVFREQGIVDVGIDGLIEQAENGNPTGKFLAVQIKSGQGNFHITTDLIIYYVSNIHYHYWLNMDLPIILIAHFPESQKTYWKQIDKKSLKRTHKQWKLEISVKQLFNLNAKSKLTQLLYDKNRNHTMLELFKGKVNEETIYDVIQNSECIVDAVKVVEKISEIILELKQKTESFNDKMRSYINNGLSDKSPQLIAGLKGFAKDLNIVSRRLEPEINLFTELYSQGLLAFEQMSMISFILSNERQDFQFALSKLSEIPDSIQYSINGIDLMKKGITSLPPIISELTDSKKFLLEVIDLIILEFAESKTMTEQILAKLIEKKD